MHTKNVPIKDIIKSTGLSKQEIEYIITKNNNRETKKEKQPKPDRKNINEQLSEINRKMDLILELLQKNEN